MLDRDTKGHLALGSALVDCLAGAGMTLPQAQAFFLVARDEGRQLSNPVWFHPRMCLFVRDQPPVQIVTRD